MADTVATTAQAFFDELDQLRRHADDLQNQLMVANDQLRTAEIEAEKAANRIDLLIDANSKLQQRADRQQGRADRAYIKLETLGRIVIQGIEDVLNDAKRDVPGAGKIDPRSVDMLKDEFQKESLIPPESPIPAEGEDFDITPYVRKPEPGAAAQYLRENAPRFGSGPRRSQVSGDDRN